MKASQAAVKHCAFGEQVSTDELLSRALSSIHQALVSAVKIPIQDQHSLEVSYTMRQRRPHIELRFLTPKGQQTLFPLLEITQRDSKNLCLRLTQGEHEKDLCLNISVKSDLDLARVAAELKKLLKLFLVDSSSLAKTKKYRLNETVPSKQSVSVAEKKASTTADKLASLDLFDEDLYDKDNLISPAEVVVPLSIEGLA